MTQGEITYELIREGVWFEKPPTKTYPKGMKLFVPQHIIMIVAAMIKNKEFTPKK